MTETNPAGASGFQTALKTVLPWAVLLAFIIGIEYWLGWQSILKPWLALDWQQLLVAFVLVLISYALRTLRLYDYFPAQMHGNVLPALRLNLLHNLFNNLLPARAGELSFPMLMKRYFKVDYAHSMSSLLWFRFLDLHTILSFAIYPLIIVTPFKRLAFPVLLVWMLIPLLIYWLRNRVELWFIGKDGKFSELAQKTLYGLPDTTASFWKSWGLTWLNWLVKLLTLAWVLDQFVDGVSWNTMIMAVVAGELTSVLPFHAPAGIGTYEAGIIAVLVPFMLLEQATRAAINVHLFVLGSAIMGGLVGWLLPRTLKE